MVVYYPPVQTMFAYFTRLWRRKAPVLRLPAVTDASWAAEPRHACPSNSSVCPRASRGFFSFGQWLRVSSARVGFVGPKSAVVSPDKNLHEIQVACFEYHFRIYSNRPSPLERVGVEAVVLLPRGHHILNVGPAARPLSAFQIAAIKRMIEQFCLVDPGCTGRHRA
jgi:hypothetical protein